MKLFLSLLCVLGALVVSSRATESCYDDVEQFCQRDADISKELNCRALYGRYTYTHNKIVKFSEEHIDISYKYLAMSAYFDNYVMNRPGFTKLYRELSDKAWEDAIELIKYSNKRGQHITELKFSNTKLFKGNKLELDELNAMAVALDTQKAVAESAHDIALEISETTETQLKHVDPEVVSYLEEHFFHKHADKVRELAGHVHDLSLLISDDKSKSMAVSLFDDYLLKM